MVGIVVIERNKVMISFENLIVGFTAATFASAALLLFIYWWTKKGD